MQIDNQSNISIEFYKKRKKEETKGLEKYNIWVDGYTCKNKEEKIWGFILLGKNKSISVTGKEENNEKINKYRIELIPVIEALQWINIDVNEKKNVVIYTSSNYVSSCIFEWIDKWKKNNYKINDETLRPNFDILQELDLFRNNMFINVVLLNFKNSLEFESKINDIKTLCSENDN